MRSAALAALLGAAALPATAHAAIRAPAGVRVSVVAKVPSPTNLAFDSAGRLWVASGAGAARSSDGVWVVPRGSSRARHVVSALPTALGIAAYRRTVYVGYARTPSRGRVLALSRFDGRRFGLRRAALDDLPIGRHAVDTIVPGPDGRLYVGVGSTFDNRGRRGRVLSFSPGGGSPRIEAIGLRNPYGLAFVPGTSKLLVTDNARDDLGPFRPPEELNVVDTSRAAPDFGFPGCYDQGGSACAGTVAPLLRLPAHASSDGLAITSDWGGGGLTAFVAENGSSFAANPTGNDVRIVRLGPRASSARQRVFASGFAAHDPLGAAIGPDGALYVTLFASGRVIRFSQPSR